MFNARAAAVIAALFSADQASKWAIVAQFELGDSRPVIPGFFDLVRAHNTGAAFSMGTGNNWFFALFSLLVLGALIFMARSGVFTDKWSRAGVVVLVPGIIGNLFDRLWHGYVVDFIHVDLGVWPANPWPAFNIADSCIFVAAALFILGSFFEVKQSADEK